MRKPTRGTKATKDTTVNGTWVTGYWLNKIPATLDGTPERWVLTYPDGEELGEYSTSAEAKRVALARRPTE